MPLASLGTYMHIHTPHPQLKIKLDDLVDKVLFDFWITWKENRQLFKVVP